MLPSYVCQTGLVAGSSGAIVGTPAEVSLIRMTSDGRSVYESVLSINSISCV